MISGTEIERLYVSLMGDKSHLDKTFAAAAKGVQGFADKVAAVGGALTKYVTAPIVAAGGLSVHAFADFDSAMTESTALIKLTGEEIAALRAKALELGATMPMGPTKAAEAYYELFSAGMGAKQAMASLAPMMRFAAAGAFDLKTAVALAEGALSALGMMSHDAGVQIANTTRITDALVRASTLVSGSVEEFGRSLTRDAGAVLKTFNKDVEEGVAVLAAYHKQQIRGAMAGTTFGRMMRLLESSARKNAAAYKQFGIAVFDAEGKMRNVADIIADFEKATAGLSDQDRGALLDKLGLKTLSQKAITPLIGMSDAIRQYEKELRAAGGTTQDVSDRQLGSFSNQMKILKNQLEIVGIEIGEMIAPAIKAVGEAVKSAIGWWKGLTPETKKFIVVAAGIAAAVGPILVGVAAVVGGVAALIAGIGAAFGTVMSIVSAIGGVIASVGLPVILAAVVGIAAALVEWAVIGAVAVAGFGKAMGGWDKVWQKVAAAATAAWQVVQQKTQEFIDWLTPIWTAAVDFAAAAWPYIMKLGVVAWEAIKIAAATAWAVIKTVFLTNVQLILAVFGVFVNQSDITWANVQKVIVTAFEIATFAIENFEVAARWAAVRIAQHFYDMANAVTLGVGGMVDEFTLGIGKALKQEEAAAQLSLVMWRKNRAEAAKAAGGGGGWFDGWLTKPKPKGPLDTFLDQINKWRDKMGDLGGSLGGKFAEGVRQELQKVEPALWGSAEAVFRIADYRQMLRDGLEKNRIGMASGGGKQGGNDPFSGRGGVIDLLKEIRDNTKDGGGVEIDVADL